MLDPIRTSVEHKQFTRWPVVSFKLRDGSLGEMLYRAESSKTVFAVWKDGDWRYEKELTSEGRRLLPYSPHNNLLRNEVVLFPSEPMEYGSTSDLVSAIQAFVHRYVDVSPLFEKLASYYVLLTWVYDAFNELPYLRLRGDPGSGKTRFLLTVGSLCYKPIFASGASTVSPLFRILDAVRGTLVIDESDFRMSDERAEIVKILNNGNARGFPVLRSEVTAKKEYSPTAFAVFGPKIVATRGYFEDRALESRCLTEEMGQFRLRQDIPITLPPGVKHEALTLRNKLLLFRFRSLHRLNTAEGLADPAIEPRLNQIFSPLCSVIDDPAVREELRDLARTYHREQINERGMDVEAQLLEVIRDLLTSEDGKLTVSDITRWFADRHGDDYERKITAKWVGILLRRRLHLRTQKSHGVFVIPSSEHPKLLRLYERYGVSAKDAERPEAENVGKEPPLPPDTGLAG